MARLVILHCGGESVFAFAMVQARRIPPMLCSMNVNICNLLFRVGSFFESMLCPMNVNICNLWFRVGSYSESPRPLSKEKKNRRSSWPILAVDVFFSART